jgi:hypothetical protein
MHIVISLLGVCAHCNRGYLQRAPLRQGARLHLAGVGDFDLQASVIFDLYAVVSHCVIISMFINCCVAHCGKVHGGE